MSNHLPHLDDLDHPRRNPPAPSTGASGTKRIERSASPGRFTEAQLRAKTAESKRFWESAEGQKRKAQLDVEQRNRKTVPARFRTNGTRPILAGHIARPDFSL